MKPPKPTLRNVLAESQVAAIAIALLLFWTLYDALRGLWIPFFQLVQYLITAVLILDIPYFNPWLARIRLLSSLPYLSIAVAELSAVWIFSHWVFGFGPVRALTSYRCRIGRRNDA